MPIDPSSIVWDDEQAKPKVAPASVTWDDAAQPKATLTDIAKRQLGRFARMGVEGVTGTGTMLLDASDAISKLTGLTPRTAPVPSQRFSSALTELGLPENITPEEKVTGFLGTAAAGAFDPLSKLTQLGIASRSNVPAAFQTSKNQIQEAAKELRQAGIKLAPSQTKSGAGARLLESIGGSSQLRSSLAADNSEVITELAKKANRIPSSSPLSLDVLKNQAKKIAEEGYDPISNLPSVPVGGLFRRELNKIAQDLGDNQSFPLAQKPEVHAEVAKYLSTGSRPVLGFSGKDAIASIKSLRQEADDLYSSDTGNKALAEAKRRIANALENQIERVLNSRGSQGTKMLENFKEARTQLSKNYATRDMLADPVTGVVDPAKAANLLAKGTPLTGELLTIAKAGAPPFRSSTRPPTGGDPGLFNRWDTSFFGGGAGAAVGGAPGAGAAVGSIPLFSAAARKTLQTQPVQNLLSRAPITPEAVRQRMLIGGANQLTPYSYLFDPYSQPK